MNAVVETREPAVMLPAQSVQAPDVQAIVAAIERAAVNPRVNLDKMDRLMAMQERILGQFREAQFNAAMASAQAEMGRIPTNKFNSHTSSHYADYAAIDRLTRPIYTRHGFGLSFDEGETPKAEHVRVLCLVTHVGGHGRIYHRDMPADGKGAKGGDVMTKTHAVGSAFSYGQRYLAKGIWNLAIGLDPAEADDDGNAAGGIGLDDTARVKAGYISNKEVADLRAIMTRVNADGPAFLSWLGVDRLEDIPKIQLKTAVRKLESKGKANTQAPRSTGGSNGRCNEKQAALVRKDLDASGIPEKYFFTKFGVASIEELPFDKVDDALNWIKPAVS